MYTESIEVLNNRKQTNTLNALIAEFGLRKLNSLTKYPSILTYHDLGRKGALLESLVENKSFKNCFECYLTEKVDGTNARKICSDTDYLIGSREEILYAQGDRIENELLNIVPTVKKHTEGVYSFKNDIINIIFGEVYGGNVTAQSKNYTNDKSYGFRVFDIMTISYIEARQILSLPLDKIASWREHGGQTFLSVSELQAFTKIHKLDTVPYLGIVAGNTIPTNLKDTYEWAFPHRNTIAGINASGESEGIVVRTNDRSLIRKIRFENYEKSKTQELF